MKRLATIGLALALAVLPACKKERRDNRSGGGAAEEDAKPVPDDEVPLRDLVANYGVRNFDQINEVMHIVTGVDPRTKSISDTFNQVTMQLPNDNDVATFSGSTQVGVVKLATGYCEVAFETPALSAAIIPGFLLDGKPNAAFAPLGRLALIEGLTTKFWGKDFADLPNRMRTGSVLNGLLDELLAGVNMDEPTVTKKIAKSLCIAVLASSPTLLF